MYIEGASNIAPMHDLVMLWVNIITITAFILTNAVMVYFVIKYRRKSADQQTSKLAHNRTIEVVWTVIPSIIFAILFIAGINSFNAMRSIPDDALEINVTGRQWSWEFRYPGSEATGGIPVTTFDDLILKEGQPVKLIMRSTDVIHSFFVPAFRVKEDVVGHMYTYVSFTPYIADSQQEQGYGEYDIFCTEYCGKDHSYMIGKAIVLPEEQYYARLAEIGDQAGAVSAEAGEELYRSQCQSCHTIDGADLVGPSFQGLFGSTRSMTDGREIVADENYIRRSILEPSADITAGFQNLMPVFNFSDQQIDSIIEFIKEQ